MISELLPPREDGYRYANADPVTGQAAWYDLRVRPGQMQRRGMRRNRTAFPCAEAAAEAAFGPAAIWAEVSPRSSAKMTALPAASPKKLGLVIDLDICVGCHACAVNCKEWNSGGHAAPLTDFDAYGAKPDGVWFNRIHTFEAGEGSAGRTVHFPKSCMHCETPACVTVCPTGASFKRAADGIVLVDEDKCIGCKLCSWGLPLWRAGVRPAGRRDEEMHALHRPHLQRDDG